MYKTTITIKSILLPAYDYYNYFYFNQKWLEFNLIFLFIRKIFLKFYNLNNGFPGQWFTSKEWVWKQKKTLKEGGVWDYWWYHWERSFWQSLFSQKELNFICYERNWTEEINERKERISSFRWEITSC